MTGFHMHHVSLPIRDLPRSVAFYGGLLGLTQVSRPPFPFAGVWFALGDRQLHLIENKAATYRSSPRIDGCDSHVALATSGFDAVLRRLNAAGYGPDPEHRQLRVQRAGPAPFAQAFLLDPDLHVIELNDATL